MARIPQQKVAQPGLNPGTPIPTSHCHLVPYESLAASVELSTEELQVPEWIFVQSGRASQATEVSSPLVGHLTFPPFYRVRVREDSGERLRVIRHWEGYERERGEKKPLLWNEQVSMLALLNPGGFIPAHCSSLSELTMFRRRANMFLNLCLCVRPRQCVLCASP